MTRSVAPHASTPAGTVRPRGAYRGSGHAGEPVDRRPGVAGRLPPPARTATWRDRRTAWIWTAAWELARRVPEPLAFGAAAVGGRIAHRRATGMRSRVRANLARVVDAGDLDAAVQAAFASYARYWVESFRAADVPVASVHARTTTDGFHHLDGVLADGRGAVVLLAHHGSWDMAARWAESHGYHLAVVAEVLRPRRLFERFVRLREQIGLEVVPLPRRRRRAAADTAAGEGGDEQSPSGPHGGSVATRLADVLRANHLVGLLTDRDLSGDAPLRPFFGEDTRIPLGAAVLAARTGAPIVPITMLQRPGRRWHLQILPPIRPAGRRIADIHADVVAGLEAIVRLDPNQWHAFQPMWPGPPATQDR